ncbi:MAG: dTDP-4-dehydrorhamnose reductase [Alistipes sp.]|nr:dTDP-4-dehydrorhamnose reductase [Alistipes sp.]
MNILITGANGQLGNEMRKVSAKSAHNYIFTDVAELDITSAEAVEQMVAEAKVDVVVNCAAYTAVDNAEDDEATADKINHGAVRNLAVACAKHNATLVHISTDYVFGGDACVPYTEEAQTAPLGVYGRTKLAGERAVEESGCNHIIIRTAWLYSEFGRNFCKTMRTLTSTKPSLKVVFDQIGSPTYAADLAEAIFYIIESRQADKCGIYHFSNEGVCSWYDFATEIARQSGNNECKIEPCHSDEFPAKVTRPHFSVLDKSKIKTTFGITIPHWQVSLAKCIEQLEKQEKKDELQA